MTIATKLAKQTPEQVWAFRNKETEQFRALEARFEAAKKHILEVYAATDAVTGLGEHKQMLDYLYPL